jgi:addiction module HigA family antidote
MSSQTIPEPHPSEILLKEFINPAGVTPYRVARDSSISQPTINQIVNGKRPISTETALRLATYSGTSCELWVNLQKNYDLRIAERDLLPRIQAEVKPLQFGLA